MIDSWTCHVCGENRPDRFISVRKHDKSEEYGMTPGTFQENIRYCNDKELCIQGSKTHSHFNKESAKEKVKENIEKINQYSMSNQHKKNNVMKYVYTFLIFFAIVMVLIPLLGVLLQDDTTFMEKLLWPTGIALRAVIASYFSWIYANKIFKDA